MTHNLKAEHGNYKPLMDLYNKKDPILSLVDKIRGKLKENSLERTFEEVINENSDLKIGKNKLDIVKNVVEQVRKENEDLYNKAKNRLFSELADLFIKTDHLIKLDEQDALISHLWKIQELVELYKEKKFSEFLRKTDYQIKSIKDKSDLKTAIDAITKEVNPMTIGQAIEKMEVLKLCRRDDVLNKFIEEKPYIYMRVCNMGYNIFQNLFESLMEKSPFATQHGVKGKEYKRVLINLDNGKWYQYNFIKAITEEIGKDSKEDSAKKARKLLYVGVTRAKQSVALYMKATPQSVIQQMKAWIGENNVTEIDKIQASAS